MKEHTALMSPTYRTLRQVMPAMSIPLASIFGSGFLVIVPVLVSSVGAYAALAMLVVSLVAFQAGAVVRHNIIYAEPVLAAEKSRMALMVERLSSLALVAAYVVSVCLYVHILSSFVLSAFAMDSDFNKSLLTSIVIAFITVMGVMGGLKPLEKMESIALYITLAILAVLLLGFALYDINHYLNEGNFTMPAMPQRSTWEMITIVAGTLIVVQGFETTRYLGRQFDARTRVLASRYSQYLSLTVYVVFVGLALPLVSILHGEYAGNSLIILAAEVSVLLVTPLIVAAALSQFSAAVADTLAAAENMSEITYNRVRQRWGYVMVGSIAIMLAWSGSIFEIITLASRAFALYYFLQCIVGFIVSESQFERGRCVFVGLALLFVLIFAVPAG
ncbi:MAG: hypothetical protein Q9M10_04655 [Mariprofundaceae bacterium]|nr:hypothetical protein [Mariprofundaceae bacterium]